MLVHCLPCIVQFIERNFLLCLSSANRCFIPTFANLAQSFGDLPLLPEGIEVRVGEFLPLFTFHLSTVTRRSECQTIEAAY